MTVPLISKAHSDWVGLYFGGLGIIAFLMIVFIGTGVLGVRCRRGGGGVWVAVILLVGVSVGVGIVAAILGREKDSKLKEFS